MSDEENEAGRKKRKKSFREELEELRRELEEMKREVTDMQRQLHKTCVVVFGGGVPLSQEKEVCGALFARLAREKYGIMIKPSDVSAVHRLGARKLICQFVHRYPGTPFYDLLSRSQQIQA